MKIKFLAASAVVLAVGAAACAPGPAAPTAPQAQGPVNTAAPASKVSLSLVSTPESGAAVKEIITAFQAKYPNVTIHYQDTNFDDYNKSLNLSLASDQAPDIVLLNSVGTTVKDGLVRDLSAYDAAYKWSSVYPSAQLDQWRVAENGTTLGTGKLYAAPAGFSEVGVYYNKTKAAELGMTTPPTSVSQFEELLARAKAKGERPLQLGNADGGASFIVQLMGQSQDGPQQAAKWIFGQPGRSFDTAGNRAAAAKLVEWTQKGYVSADANGVDAQTAVSQFTKGDGVFLVDGNWDASKISDGLRADAGFMLFPAPHGTAIGTSVAYGISAKSKNPDAAALFLDFLHSGQASAAEFKAGFMPADLTAAKPAPGTLMSDVVAAWGKVNADNGLVGFNNNATPTMNDTLIATTQQLIGNKVTVDGFIGAVQDNWAKTHG
ncbi:extracellular solute-binding protein [Amycolatopsis sp. PS_44_ISF1]|uniref:ABC transporter substrate-binding protein n=1 Tax=Amycolatopsis sp. PS_44_ISF1 TaxID=2974917 RepID=UPI0028DE3103|nr:extracellular solute-binding protein [Amycolatopsis sp. PS_44_ISF1]MDT8913707.1 extracellular solute-binding protein [Amycolatopsis sp. PS_44_ISF1]